MAQLLIDMHVHTRLGSLDSSIEPSSLVGSARIAGLSAVLVAEHYRVWDPAELERWSTDDVRIFSGIEVDTDVGHVIGVGFTTFPTSRTIEELHREAFDAGASLVLAHPFRGYFDSPYHWLKSTASPIQAATARISHHVSAIETENNGCTNLENGLAAKLHRHAGIRAVAGSDAHAASQIGRASTRLFRMPRDTSDLAKLLRERPFDHVLSQVPSPQDNSYARI